MGIWKSLLFFWLTLPSNENLLLTPISLLCERKTGTLFNSNIRSDVCCLCFTKKMNFYTFVDCNTQLENKVKITLELQALQRKSYISQYGHSQSEKKLGVGDKYHRSIKVHTQEAQNQHQLKSPLSDLFLPYVLKKKSKIKKFRIAPKFFFALQYMKN